MNLLFRYILSINIRHAIVILCGLSGIFLVFDVLSNAGKVTQQADNIAVTLWYYVYLRLPGIIVLVMPVVALLSALMTMHRMLKYQEMVIVAATGFSIYRVMVILATGGAILAGLQFTVAEYVASDSATRLRLWAKQDYSGVPPVARDTNMTLWAASGPNIVLYRKAVSGGKVLLEPMIILRSEEGTIDTYIRARKALYLGPNWQLEEVFSKSAGMKPTSIKAESTINLGLGPEDFRQPARSFEEMALGTIWQSIVTDDQEGYQVETYQLWLQRKIVQPLGTVMMAVLAAALGMFMGRRYNAIVINSGFITAGFLFLFSEKLLLSWGESQILPPFLAVWSPLLIFTSLGCWYLLHKQA